MADKKTKTYDTVIAFKGIRTGIKEGFTIYRSEEFFTDETKIKKPIQNSRTLKYCFIGPANAGKTTFANAVLNTKLPTGFNVSTVGISVATSADAIVFDFAGDGEVSGDGIVQQSNSITDNIFKDTAALTECAIVLVYPTLTRNSRQAIHDNINRVIAARSKLAPELVKLPFYVIINSRESDSTQLASIVNATIPLFSDISAKYPWDDMPLPTSGHHGDTVTYKAAHKEYSFPWLGLPNANVKLRTYIIGNVHTPLGKNLMDTTVEELKLKKLQNLVPTSTQPSVDALEISLLAALEKAINNNLNVPVSLSNRTRHPDNSLELNIRTGAAVEDVSMFNKIWKNIYESMPNWMRMSEIPVPEKKSFGSGLYAADLVTIKNIDDVENVANHENNFGDIIHKTWVEYVKVISKNGDQAILEVKHLQFYLPGCGPDEVTVTTRRNVNGKGAATVVQCIASSWYPRLFEDLFFVSANNTLPSRYTGRGSFVLPMTHACPMLTTFNKGIIDIGVMPLVFEEDLHYRNLCFGPPHDTQTTKNGITINKSTHIIDKERIVQYQFSTATLFEQYRVPTLFSITVGLLAVAMAYKFIFRRAVPLAPVRIVVAENQPQEEAGQHENQ